MCVCVCCQCVLLIPSINQTSKRKLRGTVSFSCSLRSPCAAKECWAGWRWRGRKVNDSKGWTRRVNNHPRATQQRQPVDSDGWSTCARCPTRSHCSWRVLELAQDGNAVHSHVDPSRNDEAKLAENLRRHNGRSEECRNGGAE